MSLLRSTTVMAALIALGTTTAAAQSRRPAPIWSIPDRDIRWESRNGDSDSDSDSDWDSDSDGRARRGSIFDRIDPRNRIPGRRVPDRRDRDDRVERRDRGDRGGLVERELERAHDEWHRRNDRYRSDRDYRRRHDELHDRLERARRQSGVGRRGGVIR